MSSRTELFEGLDQPHKRGQATEALIKSAFVLHDIPVLEPVYDNEPYDLVVDGDGEFIRIQCKTAYPGKAGTVVFETVSTKKRGDGYERTGYDGRADYFAVYDPVNDALYLIPVTDAADGKMEIRHEPAANGQQAGINWVEDYEFSTRVQELTSDRTRRN